MKEDGSMKGKEEKAVILPIGQGQEPVWEDDGPHEYFTLTCVGDCRRCGERVVYARVVIGMN